MHALLGRPIADKILAKTGELIRAHDVVPGLAVVLVGSDPASEIYVGLKEKAAQLVGVHFEKHTLSVASKTEEIQALVETLNERADIHGIIVQLPLPTGIDTDAVITTIRPEKDADGFHPETVRAFLGGSSVIPPVFPRAILALLESTGLPLRGKRAFVFANSSLFTQVMSTALGRLGIQATGSLGRTVHEIAAQLRQVDIVISAKGDPHFLTGSMVRPGAIIIDGGITRVGERVLSDVHAETFHDEEGFITPVPGGVGPVTVAFLIGRVAELALAERNGESILEL